MRPGTPGFVGERLKEAREVRGLTAIALSDSVDVTPQAISNYEKGRNSPSPETLSAIAATLRFPEHFFMRSSRSMRQRTIFYRSLSAATKRARTSAEWRLEWLRDMTHYVAGYVELPATNLPELRFPSDPAAISMDEVEIAAQQARRYWNMHDGPVGNMIALLENQGCIVSRDRLGAASLDSLCEFVSEDARPYIMVGTDKGTPVRWRYDGAHELGHLLIHANVDHKSVFRSETFKLIENQAHWFAGAFLLPADTFADDVFGISLDAFRAIKPTWKVSIGTMIKRVSNLGLASEDAERRLWINYSRRGWRRQEPHDETMQAERPRLLRSALEIILTRAGQTSQDVETSVGLPLEEVERLSGLPHGFLDQEGAPLRLSLLSDSGPESEHRPADVVPLPLRPRKT